MAEEKGQKKVAGDVDSDSGDSKSDEDSEEEVVGDSEKMEWGKKVEPELWQWRLRIVGVTSQMNI